MDEQTQYCGQICMAARRMGIGAQLTEDLVGWSMNWFDFAVGAIIRSPSSKDKKEAVYLGCQQLVNYLKI